MCAQFASSCNLKNQTVTSSSFRRLIEIRYYKSAAAAAAAADERNHRRSTTQPTYKVVVRLIIQ